MPTQICNDYSTRRDQYIGLNRFDEKGRKIGVNVARWEGDVVEVPDERSGYDIEKWPPGHRFFAQVQPARNHESYGATQNWFSHADWQRVEEWISARINAIDKRYAKKYGS